MVVLSKTFVPYDQFDLDIILKVTAAIFYLNLADLNYHTYQAQSSYQAVFNVLLCASVGAYQHVWTQVTVTYMEVIRRQNVSHWNT